MAQTYKMKLGTSGKQWEQLTVKDDGTMTLYFHGTDRSVTQQVIAVTEGEWKGWLRSEKGSMYPGIESDKWQAVDCPAESAEIAESAADAVAVVTNTDCTDCTENHAEAEVIEETTNFTNYTNNHAEQEVIEETTNYTNNTNEVAVSETTADCADDTDLEPVIVNQPRPRRQRKPRKPRVSHQTSAISHQTSSISHQTSDINRQTSATMKAIGMVAAATVALFVIYETGLLIPLGLIGLATGGLLK